MQTPQKHPPGIVHGVPCPGSAGMVPECPPLGPVGGSVCLGEGSIPMTPLGGRNDRKHLTALKRHLDNVLVRQTPRRVLWVRRSHEDIHRQKIVEGTLVPTLYTWMGFQTGFL